MGNCLPFSRGRTEEMSKEKSYDDCIVCDDARRVVTNILRWGEEGYTTWHHQDGQGTVNLSMYYQNVDGNIEITIVVEITEADGDELVDQRETTFRVHDLVMALAHGPSKIEDGGHVDVVDLTHDDDPHYDGLPLYIQGFLDYIWAPYHTWEEQ